MKFSLIMQAYICFTNREIIPACHVEKEQRPCCVDCECGWIHRLHRTGRLLLQQIRGGRVRWVTTMRARGDGQDRDTNHGSLPLLHQHGNVLGGHNQVYINYVVKKMTLVQFVFTLNYNFYINFFVQILFVMKNNINFVLGFRPSCPN